MPVSLSVEIAAPRCCRLPPQKSARPMSHSTRPVRPSDEPAEKQEEHMHATSKDGTKIGYDRKGAGPAIILVGGATQYRAMDQATPRLADILARHFTVINYDRRGRGESTDTQPYAPAREIEDIAALIAVAGGRAYVFGMSSGAVLSMMAAAALPNITKLAVYEPPLNPGQTSAESWRLHSEMEAMRAKGEKGKMMATFVGQFMSPEELEGFRQSPGWPGFEAVGHTIAYDYAILANATDGDHLPESWKAIKAPTLIITGSETFPFMFDGADWAAKAIPGAKRETLDGQSHEYDPAVLAPVLAEFFDS
jgi:pimeloyl-ACP methyl ester carboxylesterase